MAIKPAGKLDPLLDLDTGTMRRELINLVLTHLPVDVSFVDDGDTARYYSANKRTIFPGSPGVIGRKVQDCHPPQSVDVVSKILKAFKAGTRETAEFWIETGGKFIHIRYFRRPRRRGALPGMSRSQSGYHAHPGPRGVEAPAGLGIRTSRISEGGPTWP